MVVSDVKIRKNVVLPPDFVFQVISVPMYSAVPVAAKTPNCLANSSQEFGICAQAMRGWTIVYDFYP